MKGGVGVRLSAFLCMTWGLVVVGAAITVDDCPESLTRDNNLKVFGTTCFQFKLDKKLSYYAAQKFCVKTGGTLAMPKSKDINNFIANQLFVQFKTKEWFWIGLDDTKRENFFNWIDGTHMSYNHFARNEGPQNKHSHNTEDCIVIDPNDGEGKWRDQPCNTNARFPGHFFMCEYPTRRIEYTTTRATTVTTRRISTQPALTTEDCPQSLVRDEHLRIFGTSCYLFETGKANKWEDAQTSCQSKGGFLASINSINVNKFIQNLLIHTFKSNNPAWIGLNDMEREQVYRWADGSPMTFYNFDKAEGSTNPSGEGEDCVLLDPLTGKWRDINCRLALGPLSYSICEFPLNLKKSTIKMIMSTMDRVPTQPTLTTEDCPQSLVRDIHLRIFGTSCYLFELNLDKNGYAAQAVCQRKGGYLASVNSLSVNKFIQDSLNHTFKSKDPAWIGLNDMGEENVFTWVDGSLMTFYNFDNGNGWSNPSGKGEDCVVLDPLTGKWLDVDCMNPLMASSYLICEFPMNLKKSTTEHVSTATTQTSSTTSEPSTITTMSISTEDCPQSLVRDEHLRIFGTSCYLFETGKARKWEDAQTSCQSKGGFLASTNSLSVNKFVQDLLFHTFRTTYPAWIGLNDLEREHVYRWADGSPMTFYNFDKDEGSTNPSGEGEDCVFLYPLTGKWRDINCRLALGPLSYSICEFPLNLKKSTTEPVSNSTTSSTTIESPKRTSDRAPTRPTLTSEDCPQALVRDKYLRVFGSSCYLFESNIGKNRNSAQAACVRKGGYLASVNSLSVNKFIQDSLNHTFKSKDPAWIGLNDMGGENVYLWADGSPMTFYNFENGNGWSNPSGKGNDCVVLDPQTGKWLDVNCLNHLTFSSYHICEFSLNLETSTSEQVSTTTTQTSSTTSEPSTITTMKIVMPTQPDLTTEDCPQALVRDKYLRIFGSSCYLFESNIGKNRNSAQAACVRKGGYLASLNSLSVNKFIQDSLNHTFKSKNPAWIGLNDMGEENVYLWADGSPMTFYNFENGNGWSNPSGKGNDCVVLDPQTGKWLDVNCLNHLTFSSYHICEFSLNLETSTSEQVSTTTTQTSSTTSEPSTITTMKIVMSTQPDLTTEDCPQALVRDKYLRIFGSSCYLFESNIGKNRNSAQAACVRKGGYLASLNSLSVNKFIQDSLNHTFKSKNPAWIGLNDMGEENVYLWADGSPMTFYNFENGNGWSNPSGKGNDCVVLDPQTGKWLDVNCLNHLTFSSYSICEFPLRLTKTMTERNSTATTQTSSTTSEPSTITTMNILTTTQSNLTTKDCPQSLVRDKHLRIFGTSCYLFEKNVAKNGYVAQAACQRKGGYLASVNSLSVNKFIQDSLNHTFKSKDPAWIGLNDMGEENVFTWVDGSLMTFYNFDNGNGWGNPSGKGNDCVVLDPLTGKWRDIDCLNPLMASSYFICEFPLNL